MAHIVVPFDIPLIVHSSALGRIVPVIVAGRQGLMHWPAWGDAAGEACAVKSPAGFERANVEWGYQVLSSPESAQVAVDHVGFTFEIEAADVSIPIGALKDGYAIGLSALVGPVQTWVRRFSSIGSYVLRQSLDITEPPLAFLSPRSNQALSWLSRDEDRSWVGSAGGNIVVHFETQNVPWSELAADRRSLDRISDFTSSGVSIPPPVMFLGAGCTAANRGRFRLALTELGTCLESILTQRVDLPPGEFMTLGPLTKAALKLGVDLPKDVKDVFVDPRNAAVHNGAEPSLQVLVGAFNIVSPLVDADYPGWAADSEAAITHRPQRADLLIVGPPTGGTTSVRGQPRS